jgi:radical SAM superfamily enzyme YgiQ (UPF0313 family)
MLLLLINPRNPVVNVNNRKNYWNKYRVWKPLGLLVLAGMTPPEWEITVIDENVHVPDYSDMPRPDLVGVTAFTSQAPRAYELAATFRGMGVPVVMGGIHATMRQKEASSRVDAVVTGEAESVWPRVLDDSKNGRLLPLYEGGHADMDSTPLARHDLLPTGYQFGIIQTTRGCPLNCSFCSVGPFNGNRYRRRGNDEIIAEFRTIREKHVLVVDDNLIGTRPEHISRAKDLFRAIIDADLGKKWICQATINIADDEELLRLAHEAGCIGAFIGFESTSREGLAEVQKKYNIQDDRDFVASVRRIQKQKISVAGSFIMGLDVDRPGIGRQIADTADMYGVDFMNVLILTPLPGTRLWTKMEEEGRIRSDRFPDDWQYYTLTLPVGHYKNFDCDEIIGELYSCVRRFYSLRGISRRVWRNILKRQHPFLTMVGNLSYRNNGRLGRRIYDEFRQICDRLPAAIHLPPTGDNLHALASGSRFHESSMK